MKFKVAPLSGSRTLVGVYRKKFGLWWLQEICYPEEAERYIAHQLKPPKYYDSQKT